MLETAISSSTVPLSCPSLRTRPATITAAAAPVRPVAPLLPAAAPVQLAVPELPPLRDQLPSTCCPCATYCRCRL